MSPKVAFVPEGSLNVRSGLPSAMLTDVLSWR
jgi:hypothetical protein